MKAYIVMGVAGCGKSLTGSMLAKVLDGSFDDADDFHPASNKAKMTAKIPLTDEDRWPWLLALRERLVEKRAEGRPYVLACSALKKVYRDVLRGKVVPGVTNDHATPEGDSRDQVEFIFLKGSRELISERMGARKGHFMPTTLLDSQFATLEEPGSDEALVVNIDQTPEAIVSGIVDSLQTAN